MSNFNGVTVAPLEEIIATALFKLSSLRPLIITEAPDEASNLAISNPKPLVAPVTKAIFPCN